MLLLPIKIDSPIVENKRAWNEATSKKAKVNESVEVDRSSVKESGIDKKSDGEVSNVENGNVNNDDQLLSLGEKNDISEESAVDVIYGVF